MKLFLNRRKTRLGGQAVKQFQRLSRELTVGRSRTPLRRFVRKVFRAVKDASLTPQGVRRWGPAVDQVHGVPLYRQFLQLCWLAARYGFTAEEYYRYRMYRFRNAEAASFVSVPSNIAARGFVYYKLGLDSTPLADKRIFYRRCAEIALPVPQTVAEFEKGKVRWWNESSLPPCDLFVKQATAHSGEGAALWRFDRKVQLWSCRKEIDFDARQVVNRLSDLSREAPLVLQRCISNHPDLTDLGVSGLCTIRIVTVREPANPAPTVLLALFRMPADGEVVDNFNCGGLACAVDLNSGVLGPALRRDTAVTHLDIRFHPNTGAAIDTRPLPLWKEATALALEAHRAFPDFPSVGWDIAITPIGAVVVEGNYNWGVEIAQQAGSRPLGNTAFPDHFLNWLAKTTVS